jgi:hypothetical protein
VHCDHIGVALAEHHRPGPSRRPARQVLAEQVLSLVEDVALRAVQVLRRVLGTHRSRPEADDATATVAQRERDARAEAVVDAARLVARALHEPGLQQLLLAEAAAA